MTHTSVLLQETIAGLGLEPGMSAIDGTFGAGGHSREIAKAIGKKGRLIAFDADDAVFSEEIVQELGHLSGFVPVTENFRHIKETLKRLKVKEVDAIVLDLGLSSTQLEHSGRGFSFQRNEPLRMTFISAPKKDDVTAQSVVNQWSEESIATILKGFGEERFAGRIARAIVSERLNTPIMTTDQLVAVIKGATPGGYHRGRIHFATRTFQALRMAVNDELGAIEAGVKDGFESLGQKGRIAVISFHSIEDRLVKHLFRDLVKEKRAVLVNKKPIISERDETRRNPRARSAKLRVIEKL